MAQMEFSLAFDRRHLRRHRGSASVEGAAAHEESVRPDLFTTVRDVSVPVLPAVDFEASTARAADCRAAHGSANSRNHLPSGPSGTSAEASVPVRPGAGTN